MIAKTSARQCILQSGTLHLSPPQPRETAIALIRKVSTTLLTYGNCSLRTAPVSTILEAQAALGLGSFCLQMETDLEGWNESLGNVYRVLIGDNEFEVRYRLSPRHIKPGLC